MKTIYAVEVVRKYAARSFVAVAIGGLCQMVLAPVLSQSAAAQQNSETVYVRIENRPTEGCNSTPNMSGLPLHWEGQVQGCTSPGTDHGYQVIMPLAYKHRNSSCVYAQDVTLQADGSLTFGTWHHWQGNCNGVRVPAQNALIGYHNGQAPYAGECQPATFIPPTSDGLVRTYYHLTYDAKRVVTNVASQSFDLTPLGMWTGSNESAQVRDLRCDVPGNYSCAIDCAWNPPTGTFDELVDPFGNTYLRAFVVFKYTLQ